MKPTEPASWVGLGWTLNAAGVITRSVMGMPDQCRNYFNKGSEIMSLETSFNWNEMQRQDFYKTVAMRQIETEPDLFHFNFDKYSGSFYIDTEGIVYPLKNDGLKFEMPNCLEGQFVITTPDGTRYIFASVERTVITYDVTTRFDTDYVSYDFISSWYLSQVISPNNIDVLDFSYAAVNDVIENQLITQTESMSYSFVDGPTKSGAVDSGSPLALCGELTVTAPETPSESVIIDKLRLEKIILNSSQVQLDFVPASRTDYSGNNIHDKRLSQIITTELNFKKKFEFHHSNFNSSAYSSNEKRLRLDSLREFYSIDGATFQKKGNPYRFEYVGGSFPDPLSGEGSRGIDHWGFGNNNSITLLPAFSLGNCLFGLGANRESDEIKMRTGTLKRIIYPLGGYTEFELEANKVPRTSGYVQLSNQEYLTHETLAGGYSGSVNTRSMFCNWPSLPNHTVVELTVVAEPRVSDNVRFYLPDVVWNETIYGEANRIFIGIVHEDVFNDDDSMQCLFDKNQFYNQVPGNQTFEYKWFFDGTSYPPPATLAPGRYYIIMLNPFAGLTLDFSVGYDLPEENFVGDDVRDVGGLRLKSISDFDNTGERISKKVFDYLDDTTQVLTTSYTIAHGIAHPHVTTHTFRPQSGLLYSEPEYSTSTTFEFEAPVVQNAMGNALLLGLSPSEAFTYLSYKQTTFHIYATSQTGLGMHQGSHIGYKKVTERSVDKNDESNGYTEYYYSIAQGEGSFTSPYTHQIQNIYVGDLLAKKVFNKDSVLLIREENEYTTRGSETRLLRGFPGYKIYQHHQSDNRLQLAMFSDGSFEWRTQPNFSIHDSIRQSSQSKVYQTRRHLSRYTLDSNWKYLKQTTTKTYDELGHEQTKVVKYFYDNPNHLQLTRTHTTVDNGDINVIEINYPQDTITGPLDSVAMAALNTMSAQHMLNVPVEKISMNLSNGRVLYAERTDFSYYDSAVIVPTESFLAEDQNQDAVESNLSTKYKSRINYQFNRAKKVTRLQKDKDMSRSFIWSQDGRYLLASIDHPKNIDATFESFEFATTNVVTTESRTGRKSRNTSYLVEIPSSGTFQLTYWKKISGQEWELKQELISANVTIGGPGILIDDVRVYPIGSQMTTYTHEPGVGLTSATDPNNKITFFEYDFAGRLKNKKDHEKNILKAFEYHYKGE